METVKLFTEESQKVVKILIVHGVINAHTDDETYLKIWNAAQAIVELCKAEEG